MNNIHYPEETRETLNMLGKSIEDMEQYMDFLRCRKFRCSLIVHNWQEVKREVSLEPFTDLRYSFRPPSRSQRPSNVDHLKQPTKEDLDIFLKISVNQNSETEKPENNRLHHFCLQALTLAWPRSLHFKELISSFEAKEKSKVSPEQVSSLAEFLQSLFLKEIIGINVFQPNTANRITENPIANPLARYQINFQDMVSTQNHDMIRIQDPWIRKIIKQLDGSKSVEQILIRLNESNLGKTTTREHLDETLEIMLTNGILIE
jgi:methyltransferase-like protein